ncbi:MAG: glycosyltransferase AglD [Thermoplasmata archaeon]|jgi:uncharacterized protein (TIRG00374 family)|nr:glycosyltransferase AglD [Thermoplasmata archaeon]
MASSRLKAALLLALGVTILAAMVVWVGPGRVLLALSRASPVYLGLAVLAYAAFFVLRGWRWKTLFSQSAPDVRLSSTTGITAVGWLANSIVPLKGGDVLRAALLAKKEKVGLGPAASTVALERVLDMLGLAIVAAIGLFMIPDDTRAALPHGIARALEIAWILPILGLACLGVLVLLRERVVALASRTIGQWGRFGVRVVEYLATTLAGLAALARKPKLMLALVPQSILVGAAQAAIFAFLVAAFLPGTPLVLAFAGGSLFLLSFVVSVTPGNVGTYEAAFVAVFVALGLPSDLVVPAAILTHLTTTMIVAVLGSLGMLTLGLEGKALAWRPAKAPLGGGAQ